MLLHTSYITLKLLMSFFFFFFFGPAYGILFDSIYIRPLGEAIGANPEIIEVVQRKII